MRNIKFVAGFAICGFILSFVFGLFSHSGFLLILLKAIICSVVFAGLGFGIDFLFSSFLLDENSNDISVDSVGISKNSGISASDGGKGKVVDLVIKDEELGNGDSGNSFIVGNNRQMLNPNDIKSENKTVSESEGGNSGFVPLRKFETVNNISGTESENPDIIKASNASMSEGANGSGDGELDVLPDMSYMASESQNNEGSVIDGGGSSFSDSPVSSMSNSSKADEIVGKMKDTALIAKAISSVLSDEDSL